MAPAPYVAAPMMSTESRRGEWRRGVVWVGYARWAPWATGSRATKRAPTPGVPVAEIVETINQQWPIEPLPGDLPGDVANRWRYIDGAGEIGMIGSVTEPFCGDCTRLRLSSEGRLFTCLFATGGTDLRGPLRSGATGTEIEALLTEVWARRTDRYSEERSGVPLDLPKVEMSYIGG